MLLGEKILIAYCHLLSEELCFIVEWGSACVSDWPGIRKALADGRLCNLISLEDATNGGSAPVVARLEWFSLDFVIFPPRTLSRKTQDHGSQVRRYPGLG
jgi:hypothetical protein